MANKAHNAGFPYSMFLPRKFFTILLLAAILVVSGGRSAFAWVNPVRSPTDARPELGPLMGNTQGGSKVGIGQSNPVSKLHISGGSFLQDKADQGKILKIVGGGNFPSCPPSCLPSASARAIAVQGNYAYLVFGVTGSTPGGLYVVNVSNPAAPAVVGSLTLSSVIAPISLVIAGRYAYVTHRGDQSVSYQGTLLVIDIVNPAAPAVVATRDNMNCINFGTGRAADAIPAGRYLYSITRRGSILDISNLSNLSNPFSYPPVGDCVVFDPTWGYPTVSDAFLSYPFLYVVTPPDRLLGNPPGELRIADISDPLHPRVAAHRCPPVCPSLNFYGIAEKVFVSGRYAYILLQEMAAFSNVPIARYTYAFKIVDISNPDYPRDNMFTAPTFGYSPSLDRLGIPTALFVAGRYAYVTFKDGSGSAFLRVFDVGNPSDVRTVGKIESLPGVVDDITVSGHYAYLAIGSCESGCHPLNRFSIIDISGIEAVSADASLHAVETYTLHVAGDVTVENNLAVAGEALVGGIAGGTGTLSQLKGDVSVSRDMNVVGIMTKSSGSFEIDHPLDPLRKTLRHSFVESPDMKNIYDGITALDARGEAVVELPDYFEALNRDYRYKVTPLGRPAPDLYVKEGVQGNAFRIAGGVPDMKVSWQVTGIRKDPFAETYPIVVEEGKKILADGTVGAASFLRFFSKLVATFLPAL